MVCGSNANIFLTGKAGTGKTTFLRHIKTVCDKNLAVVAPTGVAAITAGGTTIHSFFQLPFAPFNYNDTNLFFGRLKINTERRQVFRQLELLIIDEVSMVRSDLLDAMDAILRHFRFRHNEPFGGVQVLMIGDMYQLSPVVKEDEWTLVSANYQSHYFFDSRALRQSPPVYIALNKIYRQQDQRFVDLLNAVRNNSLSEEDFALLKSLYNPQFKPKDDEDFITLTTHNNKADLINKEKLDALKGQLFSFAAKIEGEFADRNFPAEEHLKLKIGARVMFIKNDTQKVRRFFNGKMGTITSVSDEKIYVQCKGEENDIEVTVETWQNIRYGINKETQAVDEDVMGSFTQYPLRLAWAVTIHKSQGLTFEKVIIDAGAAFAPGQVYVALSRCTNLGGFVLASQVPQHRLASDSRIVQFAKNEISHDRLREVLHDARTTYQQKILLDTFTFTTLINDVKAFLNVVEENGHAFNSNLLFYIKNLFVEIENISSVGDRFCNYMTVRFEQEDDTEKNAELQQKLEAAVVHFKKELQSIFDSLKNLGAETDSKQHAREYNEHYKTVYIQLALKLHHIAAFSNGFSLDKYYNAKKHFSAPVVLVNAYAASGISVNQERLAHPQLYQQLRTLRDEICNKNKSPIYMVATAKTLEELAAYLPLDKAGLLKISGFGKVTVNKYGDRFIEIIKNYCEHHQLESLINSKPTKNKRSAKTLQATAKERTHKTTLNLFISGKDVDAIAKERGLAKSTIESHLSLCVGEGLLNALQCTTMQKIELVLLHDDIMQKEGMTAVKIKLGDEVSYFDIKLATQYKKLQKTL